MSILEEICLKKRDHIKARQSQRPEAELKAIISDMPAPRPFLAKLKEQQEAARPGLIAEIKKASPSKGVIRQDFSPAVIARAYEAGGASCLSVLTDQPYFQGADPYLAEAKAACSLPALRKDFILTPYQIYESRALGADCVLLIMAALTDQEAARLYELARSLAMDVLIEVHDFQELERALVLNPAMIGINNRNLKTLSISLDIAREIATSIPNHVFKIAESGIHSANDLKELTASGYGGFLVGSSLMAQSDITQAVKNLLDT